MRSSGLMRDAMDVIKKAVRWSPNIFKGKHKKLGEGWAENQDTVSDGITFYVKLLGSVLVDDLAQGESYSGSLSARAVAAVIAMAKTAGKKLRKVSLRVSWKGLNVVDLMTKEPVLDVSIYRISFCTADKQHDKVFAFMSRNKINETVECHAFLCAKRKIAQAVTLTVSQAFNLAKEITDERKVNLSRSQSEILPATKNLDTTHPPPDVKNHQLSLVRLELPPKSNGVHSPHTPTLAQTSVSRSNNNTWEVFEDPQFYIAKSDNDFEDDFSRLAEGRVTPATPTLHTDLSRDDIDDAVRVYQNNPGLCLHEFTRTLSVDDLLNL